MRQPLTGTRNRRAFTAAATALAMSILPAQIAHAGNGPVKQLVVPSAAAMTHSLLALTADYEHADAAEQGAILAELVDLAAARHDLFSSLVADDPATVLDAALPANIRSSLPPPVQARVEQEVDVDGELEVAIEDRAPASILHYTMKTDRGARLALHFATVPRGLRTGSRVHVHGVQIDDALALGSGGTTLTAQPAVLPNTLGAQKTVVLLVNFQDEATQPYTPAAAQSVAFTTTSNFYLENSFQQTWLTGDVFGWFTLPMSSTVCDSGALATYANQAATAAGVNLSNYTHYVYAFPQNACGWWGLGTVGGNPSQAWINGSFELKVVSHELGHNLGLYHSHALDCGSLPIGASCTSIEYGDTIDTMGSPEPGHFNAFQKEQLGWLDADASPPITTVQMSGTYSIDAYESNSANPKALKMLQATDPITGAATWYYVELRQALGFDAFLGGNTNVLDGVLIHRGSPSDGNSCDLLDMTPATPPSQDSWGGGDAALGVGQTFTDGAAGVSITPLSLSGAGVIVSVTVPDAISIPTATATFAPSATPTFTRTPTLRAATATATATRSATSTRTATSPPSSTPTTRPSPTAPPSSAPTSTPTVGVLNVVTSTDQTSYARNQTVTVSTAVAANGAAVAGATVNFTVTRSDGTTATGSSQTVSTGIATFKLRLRKQDPVGTYQAQAGAVLNGSMGSASTTFTVQ
jgi:hypothetical protein